MHKKHWQGNLSEASNKSTKLSQSETSESERTWFAFVLIYKKSITSSSSIYIYIYIYIYICMLPRGLSTRVGNWRLSHACKCKALHMNWALRYPISVYKFLRLCCDYDIWGVKVSDWLYVSRVSTPAWRISRVEPHWTITKQSVCGWQYTYIYIYIYIYVNSKMIKKIG